MTAHPCDEYLLSNSSSQIVVRETWERMYFCVKVHFIFFAKTTFDVTSYFEEETIMKKSACALNENPGIAILFPVI
jgi:hypothetical protein